MFQPIKIKRPAQFPNVADRMMNWIVYGDPRGDMEDRARMERMESQSPKTF